MGTFHSHADDALFLFGPQALSFDAGVFNDLRISILCGPEFSWILDTGKSLPACWASFTHSIPSYEPSDATRLALDHINERHEKDIQPLATPEAGVPNVVVITHIVVYTRFIAATTSRPSRIWGVLGFQDAQIEEYIRKYTQWFDEKGVVSIADNLPAAAGDDRGFSHLVAHLSKLPFVRTVYYLDRRSTTATPEERQAAAFRSRSVEIPSEASNKIRVLAVAPSKPGLGLNDAEYRELVKNVTHVVHNAWTMSEKRPVSGFEKQFKAMRAPIDLSRDISLCRSAAQSPNFKLTFQFISTIAIMGNHNLLPGNGKFAPEERATIEQLLPSGYAQAKLVCERMLDETLHRHPSLFRATSDRPGQFAGSSISGYWNEQEHLSFLLKSSQTLRALPTMEGDMCRTPVDSVVETLADLLLLDPEMSL